MLATTYLDGHVGLNNGVHRWAVAVELGIEYVPVEMLYEQEPAWLRWEEFSAWGASREAAGQRPVFVHGSVHETLRDALGRGKRSSPAETVARHQPS